MWIVNISSKNDYGFRLKYLVPEPIRFVKYPGQITTCCNIYVDKYQHVVVEVVLSFSTQLWYVDSKTFNLQVTHS